MGGCSHTNPLCGSGHGQREVTLGSDHLGGCGLASRELQESFSEMIDSFTSLADCPTPWTPLYLTSCSSANVPVR